MPRLHYSNILLSLVRWKGHKSIYAHKHTTYNYILWIRHFIWLAEFMAFCSCIYNTRQHALTTYYSNGKHMPPAHAVSNTTRYPHKKKRYWSKLNVCHKVCELMNEPVCYSNFNKKKNYTERIIKNFRFCHIFQELPTSTSNGKTRLLLSMCLLRLWPYVLE